MGKLLQNAFLAAAAHRAAGAGDDAVGALAVAAVLHLDKGAGMLGKPLDGQLLKLLALLVGADVHDALLLAVQHLLHQAGQNAPAAGAGHHVGLRHRGGFLRERLGVAAGQDRDGLRMLPLLPAQPFAAFLVAEVGDGAAVDHIDVRLLAGFHHRVAVGLKQLCQGAGLVLVDLAAQGIKIDPHIRSSFAFRLKFDYLHYIGKRPKAQAAIFPGPTA